MVLSFLLHFCFITNFTYNSFTPETMQDHFGTGIFRFRVLGRWLVMWVFEQIHLLGVDWPSVFEDAGRMVRYLDDQKADFSMYLAFVLINSVSLHLLAGLLWWGSRSPWSRLGRKEGVLWVGGQLLFVALTLYVVTPYDMLSYLWIVGGCLAWISWLVRGGGWWLGLFFLCVVLGTLTRESSLLLLCFAAAWGGRGGTRLIALGVGSLLFAMVYLGLRILLGWDQGVFELAQWRHNIASFSGWIGLQTAFILGYLVYLFTERNQLARTLILRFLALASPYIGMILYTGLVVEIRLWAPLLLPVSLLAMIHSVPENGRYRQGQEVPGEDT
ncbi:MAG: hypothetical protein D6722_23740 [Bacteroidetes bacterium]|nr:MAG: hypothetical protein D6722_23740 [Bacteroidota bacterium]